MSKEIKEEVQEEMQEEIPEDLYPFFADAHTCDYNWAGECKICGNIRYGSFLYRELYGGD